MTYRNAISMLALLLAPMTGWARNAKIHAELEGASDQETVRVIVRYKQAPAGEQQSRMRKHALRVHHQLDLVGGVAISVPAATLEELAADPDVDSIVADHPVSASLDIAAAAVNAAAAWNSNQIGSGIGVAIIDSGISNHPDLNGRVVYRQDFTGENQWADLYGHGTHVAAAVGGTGSKSSGTGFTKTLKGMAPGVNFINLRALNSAGAGTDSTVIAAIQKAIALKSTYNIRVINLSLGRAVTQSYTTDPLCQAVEAAWKAGIVVVVSAGNYGRTNNSGINGYGTITAPGNDPYVITVGAMKGMGTPDRSDDRIATYSSKGPTLYDHVVKPDIVAPGNQMRAALTPDKVAAGLYMSYSTTQFYCKYYNSACNASDVSQDYYMLNGTSMAAPIVSGAAAILIGAHPTLTPDQVKARLMKTAYKSFPASSSVTTGGVTYTSYYDIFTIGAGYLDIQAALNNTDLATGNALSPAVTYNASTNTGALSLSSTSAFSSSTFSNAVVWGTGQFVNSTGVVWGTSSTWSNAVVWGTSGTTAFGVVWGTGTGGTVNPAGIVWDTTTAGSITPLVSVLTKGE